MTEYDRSTQATKVFSHLPRIGSAYVVRVRNVCGEFSLTALAYNLRRAITIIGVPGLIQAVHA